MDELSRTGSSAFLAGVERIGIRSGSVPQLAEVNRRLATLTVWSAVAVHGFIPARLFFGCLAERRFPTTVRVRPRSNLDYLPGDPDIFHDVFGHVPMHADAQFADFLQRCGQIAGSVRSEEEFQQLARCFWFTVEFGLIREGGDTRLYGSGLMSSHGESAQALGPGCERRLFMLDAVLSELVPVSADEINTYHRRCS
jgi:phenylalanine-4-hydroxylase